MAWLVPGGSLGPEDGDGDTAPSGAVDDIGRSAVPASRPSVPDSQKLVDAVEHGLATGHMRHFGGVGVVEALDVGGPGDESVVGLVMLRRKVVPIPGGRNNDVEFPAVLQYLVREDRVGSVGKKRHAHKVSIELLQSFREPGGDERGGLGREPAVTGNPDSQLGHFRWWSNA